MIRKLTYYISDNHSPYINLAMEQFLTMNVAEDECLLFLWQNEHTVVIGRNQNCWKECRVSLLEAGGGHLARRLSGGGAVYHDLGNLNFSFCVRKENENTDRQISVIVEAVRKLGVMAKRSGRNDLVAADGRKFSGSAFFEKDDHCCHHGTLLVCTDAEKMSRYLSVSKEKLETKGIQSVRSRVVNLSELMNMDLTDTGLISTEKINRDGQGNASDFAADRLVSVRENLLQAFGEVYGLPVTRWDESRMDRKQIGENAALFSSWAWIYGRKMAFTHQFSQRFSWGEVTFEFAVKNGIIMDVSIYSDTMAQDFILAMAKLLKGCQYDAAAMGRRMREEGLKYPGNPYGGTGKEAKRYPGDLDRDGQVRDILQMFHENL